MAYTVIPAGATDPDSPALSTTMDELRNNDDEIMRSKPLLRVYGDYIDPAAVTQYQLNGQVSTGIGPATALIGHYRIYIPNGITSLLVTMYSYDSRNDVNHGIRITINGVSINFYSQPPAFAWQAEQAIVPGAVGWQEVTVIAVALNANAVTEYIRGLMIRPNV